VALELVQLLAHLSAQLSGLLGLPWVAWLVVLPAEQLLRAMRFLALTRVVVAVVLVLAAVPVAVVTV